MYYSCHAFYINYYILTLKIVHFFLAMVCMLYAWGNFHSHIICIMCSCVTEGTSEFFLFLQQQCFLFAATKFMPL